MRLVLLETVGFGAYLRSRNMCNALWSSGEDLENWNSTFHELSVEGARGMLVGIAQCHWYC